MWYKHFFWQWDVSVRVDVANTLIELPQNRYLLGETTSVTVDDHRCDLTNWSEPRSLEIPHDEKFEMPSLVMKLLQNLTFSNNSWKRQNENIGK